MLVGRDHTKKGRIGEFMKIGSLVTLSSYGRKLKMYSDIAHGDLGLVTKLRAGVYGECDLYTVIWLKSAVISEQYEFARGDLKCVPRRTRG